MATYYHGKLSKLQTAPAGSTTYGTLAIKSFSATPSNPKQDTSSTISGGFREYQAGLSGMEVEFTAQWDSVLEPFASPPALIEGTIVPLKFWVNGTITAPSITGNMYLESVAVKQDVDKVVEFTVKGAMTASYSEG